MKKHFFFFLFLISSFLAAAQTYNYIGVEDGLSNRRVYAIQKGPKGYMWFLTHDGIDRYNGKEFKHYKLMDGEDEINSMMNLNWLYSDSQGRLWEIGKQGRVFCYESKHDRFQLVYKLPKSETEGLHTPVSYGFIDDNNIIWLCNQRNIYLYNSLTKATVVIKNEINESITDIEQIDETHYFIGTDVGVHYAELRNNVLALSPCEKLDTLRLQINELFFHKGSRKIFIGTFQRGIYVYDLNLHKAFHIKSGLIDVSINRICTFGEKDILIATDGAGVYKMDVDTYRSEPYIVADFNRYNAMNGNTIYDIYVDNEQRIWMANYPIGITVRNNRYSDYKWIKHSIGNKQSLINDQVNAVMEDEEGDLWYATNNGISLYEHRTQQWHSFLSVYDKEQKNQSHTFMSLCEVSPGIIWVGGYSSGIYQIDKKKRSVSFFTPALFGGATIRPDKYIRSITKDRDGYIWSGGYYNLKRIDLKHKNIESIPGLEVITDIKERDEKYMWIGTANGLYLLEKTTGKYRYITLPVESSYIYSLYQAPNGLLYIGTNNSGLLIYDPARQNFEHYHKDNCALISNNIYTILSDGKDDILLSTEYGLSGFYLKEKRFHNWTKEQGLHSDHFNANSGTLRKNGNAIFGSTDGAIEFPRDMVLPREYSSRMIFSDLRVFYQTVYPKDEGSPLVLDIDETKSLKLKYSQNIFSLQVSSINYDYPSLILYSWKLEGFYDGWSRPGEENVIRFTNLNPGHYTLRVRAISSEDRRMVLEERSIDIIVEQPIWLSIWALLLYALILVAIASIALRIIVLRKQRKISDDKIRFFVNTAHDIRTPLTLIKAPLEELSDREKLSKEGTDNLSTALRNVNALLRLTTNLINFERADTYSNNFYVSEYELGAYMTDIVNVFRSYASVKHIDLTYESNFRYLNVWLDKDKMDSILKNIISNALKYTPEGGSVHVYAYETEDTWNVEVSDTGIGIPLDEQKKLFKMHFRGSIEFPRDMVLPREYSSRMIFSDLRVFYQTVYPKDEGSPLVLDIDETKSLKLKYSQNIFSLQVSSINYDYPSLILYSWKLEGFYDGWSRPGEENVIRFTNLNPGHYTLRVRAISSEDRRMVLEERSIDIIVEQPIWLSIWALLLYALILVAIASIALRIIVLRKQRKISDDKIRFFVNTAHDIRTPLTLIKAPLEELSDREKLSKEGTDNLSTALRNVNALLRLTTNLINFERADTYSNNFYVSEYELGAYMTDIVNVFRSYASVKHIDLTYESNFRYLNVWLDKDKMDSILKNIISNALKYTPEGGSVHVYAYETEDTWNVEVSDTGIGIPLDEQKKLFKMHFRGSNAINSKVTGSGIGLLLVWKLVHMHKGKLNFTSTEGKGSCIKVSFPKGKKRYRKAIHRPAPTKEQEQNNEPEQITSPEKGTPDTPAVNTPIEGYEHAQQQTQDAGNRQKILIVEDNDELREYLRRTLAENYHVQVCSNGKSALCIVKEYFPDLIISDIMMPEMRGDELCQKVKNDIDTSHIPVILLTALNTDKNIIDGLQTGADEYVVKPFNIGILRATIANLLANRALLRHRYGNLELNDDTHNTECINCSTDLDWKFIASIKKNVEDNMDNPSFTIDVLCTLLNMSRTSFYNKLKALTDQAPGDYVRLIRLKRAMQLLKEQKYTITEVAEMTGFSDAKYFREVFKKHFNISPSQYAKEEGNIGEGKQ